MTMEDLSKYTPVVQEPIYINFSDTIQVFSPPIPSGGPELLLILNVMKQLGLNENRRWDNITYQHLVEVLIGLLQVIFFLSFSLLSMLLLNEVILVIHCVRIVIMMAH